MNIAVFFGGKNTEHDVSIITGQLIISGLKKIGHTVYPVYIAKDGKWYIDERMDNVEFFKPFNSKGLGEFNLNMSQNLDGSLTIKTSGLFPKTYKIDLAFPAIHGKNGEDGTIQGMFEMLNIPYVGCGVVASGIAMDKVLTKLFYQRFNFPTTKFVHFTTQEWQEKKDSLLKEINNTLTWPVFVKPARLGSSIGMTKVKSEDDLEFAIEVALHYDNKVLVEESVEDLMDVTVCLIGNQNPRYSLIQESAFSSDFFSYEDKYLNEGGAQLGNAEKSIVIPARLDEKTTQEIREMASEIYMLMGMSGIARVDFLYNKTYKKFYANEINTLPGTLYYHLWKKSGIELDDLLKMLVDFALEKKKEDDKLTYTFESTILKSANSNKLQLKGGQNSSKG
ncbi:D-alanine--D-alanine ligase [Candidatus Dojkabacteria bacterium]|nr:D-alanine--D-alanine ligase [Candidatus Dojkabacteria bacterium]